MDYHTFCQKFNICGLNEQQEAAVRRVNGATLLLAVPGSGKTTVIVARTGYLMYVAGVKPENILTITYTRAAAKEMKERFIKKFAPERIPAFSTINSFCLSVINTCAKEKYIHVPKLVPNNESIVRAIAAKMLPEYPSDSQVRSLAQKVCKVKNKLMTFQEIEAIEENSLDFSAFYQAYKLYMSEHDLMDFDDQLLMANDLLDEYPDILQRAHEKFRYVSVDEAQDTSYVQHLIVQKLVGRNGNIFMVGDEDQSIYGFRGAYPAALLDFQSNYNEPCTVPYGVGVLCPDGGHLRCVRKAVRKDRTRPVSEMLLMLWRSSRRDFPATDVAPVMHTRWAHLGGDEWCCPACGFVITTEGSWDKPTKKYCEDCGAKMDGGADHEDRQD